MSHRFYLSPYRIMWVFVMFDLPVGTKKERKQAMGFRQQLLDMGFEMSQFSVYLKYCSSREKAEASIQKIKPRLPSGGKVDILVITDKQFSGMRRWYGGEWEKNAGKPRQLHLF